MKQMANILKASFPLEEISRVNASAYWVENSSDYHFTAINILYGESCKCRKILVFGKQLGRNPRLFNVSSYKPNRTKSIRKNQ